MKGFRFLFLFLVLALLVSGTILVGTKTIPHASAANSNGKSSHVQNAGLAAISAVSATNIWAVGGYYDSTYTEHALIEHWNGSQWSVVPAAASASGFDDLVAVKAISSTNVWAVGSSDYTNPIPLIEHWNGFAWSIVPGAALPAGGMLHGLAVVNAKDIWVVGDTPNASYGKDPVTEHWDGTLWSSIPVATNASYYNNLSSVTAIASNNVWAVGSTVNTQTNDDTLVEHWDGAVWSIIPSPGMGSDVLMSVTATSAKDVWAVGYYGPEQYYSRLVEHWNGTTWSIVKSPYSSVELRGNYIEGVASLSTTNAWLVGSTVFSDLQGFAEHWNGIKWSVVPVAHPGPGTTADELAGVATITSNNVWAVGSQNYSNTLIEHWNGSQWQIVPSP